MPWARVVVEIPVIVLSVLIAFGLEAWWTERQAQASAQQYLESLRQELEMITGRVERSIRLGHVAEDAAKSWLSSAPDLSDDSLNVLLGGMVMWATADLTLPSTNALLSSGAIELIEDSAIRTWLQNFPVEAEDFEEEEVNSIEFIDAGLVPYLAQRGVSLGNSDPLGMGLQGRAPRHLVRLLVDDWGFEALVVWRAAKARDVIDSAQRVLVSIEEGQAAIAASRS